MHQRLRTQATSIALLRGLLVVLSCPKDVFWSGVSMPQNRAPVSTAQFLFGPLPSWPLAFPLHLFSYYCPDLRPQRFCGTFPACSQVDWLSTGPNS